MSDALYEPLTVEEPEERSASYGGDAFELLKADRVCYLVAAPRAELSRGGGVGGAARRLCRSLRDGCCAPPHLKALVLDARFECRRGDFRAILGASGAGKSTFLQALSGRASGGVLAGAVTTARRTPELTCGETLDIAAALRRPREPRAARQRAAARAARDLELEACAGTAVGGALDKGLSGGQLRRLSVACATLGTGGHVLIDEPTSGLDSRTAAALCAVLRSLASGDRRLGVACSIHTPPPECWAALDGVLVLATGGATLYAGSPAGAAAAVRARLGDDAPNGSDDAADFVVRASVARGVPARCAASAPPADDLLRACDAAVYNTQTPQPPGAAWRDDLAAAATRLFYLAKRAKRRLLSDTAYLRGVLLVRPTIIALGARALFGAVGDLRGDRLAAAKARGCETGPSAAAQDCCAVLFFFVAYAAMNSLEAIPQLFARRAAYARERDADACDAVSPPLEAVVAAASRLPLLAGSLLVFSAIAVPLLGFLAAPAHAATRRDEEPCGFWDTGGCDGGTPTAAKLRFFGQVYAVVLAFQWTAYWAALALACACPSAAVALGAFPALLMVNLTLSGFNVPLPGLSKPLRVLAAASPCRYAFEALCALALRPWPGGDDALDFISATGGGGALAPCLLALCGCGAAALAGVYAALAAAPPAPRRPVKRSRLSGARRRALTGSTRPRPTAATTATSRRTRRSSSRTWATARPGATAASPWASRPSTTACRRLRGGRGAAPPLHLLRGCDGAAEPGELVALLGASGAGKTTLLDVLAGRATRGVVDGAVLYNGAPLCDGGRRQLAYAPQDLAHVASLATLAPGLALRYAARLRGPTTGLDGVNAGKVVDGLRRLADGEALDAEAADPRAVLATVHQPSPAAFARFDRLLLLAAGRVVYFGDAGHAEAYLAGEPCGVSSGDAAAFAVAVAAGTAATSDGRPPLNAEALADAFAASARRRARRACSPRGAARLARERAYLARAACRGFVVVGAYAALYRDVERDACAASYDALGLLFFVLLFVVMTQVQSVALVFGERTLFERERAAKAYAAGPYAAATFAVYGLFAFGNAFLVAAAVALACGLGGGDGRRVAALSGVAGLAGAGGFALCAGLAAVARTPQAATMLFSLASFLAVALAGYLVKLPGLPRPLRAAAALSFPRWAYEAAVLHEFAGRPGSRRLRLRDASSRAASRTRRSAPASPRSARCSRRSSRPTSPRSGA
ncbi:ATPase [Aureococcus anophagefferens]|nr:ATPase [Aureococcus anophagefferens]